MPYIDQKRRRDLLPAAKVENIGELNFLMTQIAIKFIKDHGLSYDNINAVMGCFACASNEFYDRVARPYEDKAIKKNGDVYPHTMTKGVKK